MAVVQCGAEAGGYIDGREAHSVSRGLYTAPSRPDAEHGHWGLFGCQQAWRGKSVFGIWLVVHERNTVFPLSVWSNARFDRFQHAESFHDR
jgi:hypothetical protein